MNASKTAIVVGAGFGGLALAIRLQASGIQTTLLEKRDKPGGRAYVYEDQGFVPARKLCRDIPGAAPWIVRHPWLPGILAIPAFFIVGTLFVLIYSLIAGHYPS